MPGQERVPHGFHQSSNSDPFLDIAETFGFTAREIQAFRDHFKVIDTDNDGHISHLNLQGLCRRLGIRATAVTIEQLIEEVDTNKNGRVEFDEFVRLMYRLKKGGSSNWQRLLAATRPLNQADNLVDRYKNMTLRFLGASPSSQFEEDSQWQNASFFERRDVVREPQPPSVITQQATQLVRTLSKSTRGRAGVRKPTVSPPSAPSSSVAAGASSSSAAATAASSSSAAVPSSSVYAALPPSLFSSNSNNTSSNNNSNNNINNSSNNRNNNSSNNNNINNNNSNNNNTPAAAAPSRPPAPGLTRTPTAGDVFQNLASRVAARFGGRGNAPRHEPAPEIIQMDDDDDDDNHSESSFEYYSDSSDEEEEDADNIIDIVPITPGEEEEHRRPRQRSPSLQPGSRAPSPRPQRPRRLSRAPSPEPGQSHHSRAPSPEQPIRSRAPSPEPTYSRVPSPQPVESPRSASPTPNNHRPPSVVLTVPANEPNRRAGRAGLGVAVANAPLLPVDESPSLISTRQQQQQPQRQPSPHRARGNSTSSNRPLLSPDSMSASPSPSPTPNVYAPPPLSPLARTRDNLPAYDDIAFDVEAQPQQQQQRPRRNTDATRPAATPVRQAPRPQSAYVISSPPPQNNAPPANNQRQRQQQQQQPPVANGEVWATAFSEEISTQQLNDVSRPANLNRQPSRRGLGGAQRERRPQRRTRVKRTATMRREERQQLLQDPKVRAQLSKLKQHQPYFMMIVCIIFSAYMAYPIILNHGLEPMGTNIMAGPSTTVLIQVGAKFALCVREPYPTELAELGITSIYDDYPCPSSSTATNCTFLTTLTYLCTTGSSPFFGDLPDQYWRFLSPIFLHQGIIHLGVMVILHCWIGFKIERDLGFVRTAAIWLVSGILGNVVAMNLSPLSVTMGSDAAMYGLFGLMYLDLFQNWRLLVSPWRNFFFLTFAFIFALAIGLLPFIDNYSHFGGFVGGILAGLIFAPMITFGVWDGYRKKILVVVALLMLFALYFAFLWVFFRSSDAIDCPQCQYIDCVPVGTSWCATFFG